MTQLPEAGPERDIFLRALRDYADCCEPPHLTASCPFSIDLPKGGRGCGEQCIDLLAKHGAPDGIDEIQLGSGIGLTRRRRPRRRSGPDAESKAFDAMELFLRDRDQPLEFQSTTSLMMGLKALIVTPPPEDEARLGKRTHRVEEICGELETRGFDTGLIIRGGLVDELALVIAVITTAPIAEPDPDDPMSQLASRLRTKWRDEGFFAGHVGVDEPISDDNRLAQRIYAVQAEVIEWIKSAPAVELVAWVPKRDITQYKASPPDSDGRWLVDRFTGTYFDDWTLDSLRAEWEWITGRRSSPVPQAAMGERRTPPDAISAQIADLSVAGIARRSPTGQLPHTMGLHKLAQEYLESRRYLAAAAVFEAALVVEPGRARYENNRGFCLIPVEPHKAIEALDRAHEMGYEERVLNTANRALALIRSGRYAVALRLVEDGYELAMHDAGPPALVWAATTDEHPDLEMVEDLRLYLAQLALLIASLADDPQLEATWRARIADLTGGE